MRAFHRRYTESFLDNMRLVGRRASPHPRTQQPPLESGAFFNRCVVADAGPRASRLVDLAHINIVGADGEVNVVSEPGLDVGRTGSQPHFEGYALGCRIDRLVLRFDPGDPELRSFDRQRLATGERVVRLGPALVEKQSTSSPSIPACTA